MSKSVVVYRVPSGIPIEGRLMLHLAPTSVKILCTVRHDMLWLFAQQDVLRLHAFVLFTFFAGNLSTISVLCLMMANEPKHVAFQINNFCYYKASLVDYILFYHIGAHCNNTLQCAQLSSLKYYGKGVIYLFIYLFILHVERWYMTYNLQRIASNDRMVINTKLGRIWNTSQNLPGVIKKTQSPVLSALIKEVADSSTRLVTVYPNT
jgi:hypothetical protein